MRKFFTLEDITERIMLTLPVRFSREQSSNVYKFFESLADSFQIDADKIDELIAQTNLSSASGEYLDQYIQGLIGIGRLKNSVQDVLATEEDVEISTEEDEFFLMPWLGLNRKESDPAYKDRGDYILYKYNPTSAGLRQIVIDFSFQEPINMYTGSRRGAFYSNEISHSKYFFNDPAQSYYGAYDMQAFTGFIELKKRPDDELIEQLCNHIQNAKAFGIQIYIKYPLSGIEDGKYVYNFEDRINITDSLSLNDISNSQNVFVTDNLQCIIITKQLIETSFADNVTATDSLSLSLVSVVNLTDSVSALDNLSYIITGETILGDSVVTTDSISYAAYNAALIGSAVVGNSIITQ